MCPSQRQWSTHATFRASFPVGVASRVQELNFITVDNNGRQEGLRKLQNNKLVPPITACQNAKAIGNLTIITCTANHLIYPKMQCDYSQTEPLTTGIHFSSVCIVTPWQRTNRDITMQHL